MIRASAPARHTDAAYAAMRSCGARQPAANFRFRSDRGRRSGSRWRSYSKRRRLRVKASENNCWLENADKSCKVKQGC